MQWTEFRSHIRHLSSADQGRVEKAFRLGEKAHAGQKRKSGEPYFTHPIAIADMLADMGADSDTIIAALLHDTLEDTTLTMDTIEREFGPTVTALIDGVTKLSRADIGEKPTLDEQTETLRKIFTLMQEDIRIMVIKLIDRLHNMQTVEFLPAERQRLLAQETQDIYVKIADRLCMQDLRDDLQELCLGVLEPDLFVHLAELRTDSERRGQKIVKKMEAELAGEDALSDVTIAYDEQSWNAYRKKFEVEGGVATGIAAISIAFLCPDRDTCYRVLGALHERWRRETLSFQDFINSPQINGYQGLHTTVILSDGSRVRCKIRTHDMQRYADNGITTICFGSSSAKGIMDELPWARRIAALSEDTKDRSREFWESLQSDILGESIVIHGPSDESVHLPAGSTALDGAFFLFHETALRTASIKVNGLEVPFQTTLKHGDAVNVTLGRVPAVVREWLTWTKTGLATAKIRAALAATQTQEEKLALGKTMLQQVMDAHHKGFIEEFDKTSVRSAFMILGYDSLDEVYIALADGRIEPRIVYAALFEKPQESSPLGRNSWTLRYTADMNDVGLMDRLATIHRKFRDALKEWRYTRPDQVSLKLRIDGQSLELLSEQLKESGATDITVASQRSQWVKYVSIVSLVLLWGLDPVFAKILLQNGVHPMSFALIRTVSVFLFALCTLQWTRQNVRLARISLTSPSLWLSGIAFLFVSIFTYYALDIGSPVLYNTVFRSNAFLVSLPVLLQSGNPVSIIGALALTGGGLFALSVSDLPAGAFAISLVVLLCFSMYTIASNRFQKSAHVQARLSQFFTVTSAIAAAGAILAFALFRVPLPSFLMIALVATYSICFIATPYLLFYKLRREIGYAAVSPWNHLLIAVTFAGQWLFFGIDHIETMAAAALLLLAGSLVASRTIRLRS